MEINKNLDYTHLTKAATDKQQEKTIKAAKEWESYFIGYMLKEMRKTIPKSDVLGSDGFAKDTYYEMLDQQLAQNIAENGGFGFANSLYKNLFNQQMKIVNQQELEKVYKGV
ncbi:MAG: rod-binding protein [Candidatus Margulisbacteria bacterium]|nr:rod-binding protein [Candidatus Margulisiibacteriota bacterium]